MITLTKYRNKLGKIILSGLLAIGLIIAIASTNSARAAGSTFSIGWWTGVGVSDLTRIDPQKAAGETLQTAYFTTGALSYTNYLGKLQLLNITAFLQVDPTAAKSGNTTALVSFVNTYKSQPNVAGWLLYDEPEFNAVGADTLVKDYQAIKAADPSHPVAIIFGNGYCSYIAHSLDSNYFNSADIIMFDSYPIFNQAEFGTTSDGRNHFTDYAYTVNDCLSYVGGLGKKFMITAQGFNWGSGDRNPTYGEERYFTFQPLIHNVAGLLYWVDYKADATLTGTVHTVMSEASSLSGVLQGGKLNDSSVSVNNTGISYKYGSSAGNTYIIAENDTASTISVKFTLPSGVQASGVTLVDDGYNASTGSYQSRTIPASPDSSGRAAFSDTFTQYQVHIYQVVSGTVVSPTATNTPTATFTNTPQATFQPPTNTSVPPTATSTDTPTDLPTAVLPTATATNTPTDLPTATDTSTNIPLTATSTNTPTDLPTAVLPTATATNTPTDIPATATFTDTPQATAVAVNPTDTPTDVLPTATSTNTPTDLPTATFTNTAIPTVGSVRPTATSTDTPTDTPIPTVQQPTAIPTKPSHPGYRRPGVTKVPSGPYHAQDGNTSSQTYVVQSGDTLAQIAQRYGVSVQALTSSNSVSDWSNLKEGQKLIIPADTSWYTVQAGDSLPSIAQRFGMSVDTLVAANADIANNPLTTGQQLVIPVVDLSVMAQVPTKTFTPLPTNTVQPTSTPTNMPALVAQLPTAISAAPVFVSSAYAPSSASLLQKLTGTSLFILVVVLILLIVGYILLKRVAIRRQLLAAQAIRKQHLSGPEGAVIREAARLLADGEKQNAAVLIKSVLRNNANNAEAWYLLSFAADDLKLRINALERTLRLNPGHDRAPDRLAKLRPARD